MELARHACRQLAEQPLTAPERVVAEADLVAELCRAAEQGRSLAYYGQALNKADELLAALHKANTCADPNPQPSW